MADDITVTPGSGATIAADDVGGKLYQRIKIGHGVDGAAADVTSTTPLPVREPVNGAAVAKGGGNASATAQTLVIANSSRSSVEVANAGTTGIWLAFGSTAVVGQGTYLPSKATGVWGTTAAVSYILESGGTAGPVGYTEW